MPCLDFEEVYDAPYAVVAGMVLDGKLFEQFHNTVQKHKDAVGSELVEADDGVYRRTMTYTIPEHGVLKLLKQGDTFVTQKDEANKLQERTEYSTKSTSDGGELAKSVCIDSNWEVTPVDANRSRVKLQVLYSFNASMLVRSLVEKGLKGEITNRHKRLLDFYARCIEEQSNTERRKKRATVTFETDNGSFQFHTPLQQSMAAPPSDMPKIALGAPISPRDSSRVPPALATSMCSIYDIEQAGSRASWGGMTFMTAEGGTPSTSPLDSPLEKDKKKKKVNILRPIKPLSEASPLVKKKEKPKKRGWTFRCCCVYVEE